MAYRFYGFFNNGKLTLSDEDIFHLTRVIRIKPGETFEIVEQNTVYMCVVSTFSPFSLEVMSQFLLEANKVKVTLYYALPKGDKLDLVVQKAVEIGVNKIVLINTKNAVVKFEDNKVAAKIKRLEAIIKSAAMQSKALLLPSISGPIAFKDAFNNEELMLFAHEKATLSLAKTLRNLTLLPQSIALFVGAEGGFSNEEASFAKDKGAKLITFGNNILRSETAAIYGLSVIANFCEEWK